MYKLFKFIRSRTLIVVVYSIALRPRPRPKPATPRPRPVHAKTKTKCFKTKIKTCETRSWLISRPSPGLETTNSGCNIMLPNKTENILIGSCNSTYGPSEIIMIILSLLATSYQLKITIGHYLSGLLKSASRLASCPTLEESSRSNIMCGLCGRSGLASSSPCSIGLAIICLSKTHTHTHQLTY